MRKQEKIVRVVNKARGKDMWRNCRKDRTERIK